MQVQFSRDANVFLIIKPNIESDIGCLDESKKFVKKRDKIKVLLDRLKHAKNVQNGDLKTWFSAELYANFESIQREQTELRDELASKLNEVVEYKRRLKLALFANSKAEGYRMRYKCITDAISA